MQLTMRAYQTEEDYWRIRAFQREVFLLNDRRDLCWHVARLDYWRWHVIENCNACEPVKDVTFIWETPDEQMAAVLNPEGRGEAHLQVHPGRRTPELEEEMIVVAEQQLAGPGLDGQRALRVFADGRDTLRHDILLRRGYTQRGLSEHQWRRELDMPIPDVPVAPGYTVHSLGDTDELPTRSWASWRAFHWKSQTNAMKGGSGIITSKGCHFIAVIWTWWPSPRPARSLRFAPSGTTT